MAFSTLPNTLDDKILYTLTDMNQQVYTLVNETYDLLDRFIENPSKELTDFVNSRTDNVQLADEGKCKPKQARFVAVKNDRQQLKAIFKNEVEKQKNYFADELKKAHVHCLDQLAHGLTLPFIAADPQDENPQSGSLVQQRKASQRKFQELVNQFLNETNHILKQMKAKLIEDDNLPDVDTQFLNAQEFSEFERCDETKNTMAKSNKLFSEALDQLFMEMKTFLFDRIDNDLQFFIVRN